MVRPKKKCDFSIRTYYRRKDNFKNEIKGYCSRIGSLPCIGNSRLNETENEVDKIIQIYDVEEDDNVEEVDDAVEVDDAEEVDDFDEIFEDNDCNCEFNEIGEFF